MKKLMVMAVVVCAAVAAQAEKTYVWFYCPDMVEQILYTPDSTPMQGTISLFVKESNIAKDYAQVGDTLYMSEGGVAAECWTVVAGIDRSKAYDFYYVIDGAGYNDWVYTSGVGAETSFNGDFDPDYTAGSWSQVPEPTSGVLMLLGLAGIALKRKRA